MFFRVQVLQGQGFSGSGSRTQGPGPESRVQSPGYGSRVRVQILEVAKKSFFNNISINILIIYKEDKKIFFNISLNILIKFLTLHAF